MPDYTELDSCILKAIQDGEMAFSALINTKAVQTAARSVETHQGEYDRAVDRRLQSLRKSGKIEFSRGSWKLKN